MAYRDLAHPVPEGARKHRYVAMQLAVKLDRLEYLTPVGFEPTIEVVQPDAADARGNLVEEARRQRLGQGVVQVLLPPDNNDVYGVERFDETRNFAVIVLEICVHSDQHVTRGGTNADHQGGGLAEVAPEPNGLHNVIVGGQLRHDAPAAVGAAVIDQHDIAQ